MKHKKEVTVPAKTHIQTVKVTCDLCGHEQKSYRDWDGKGSGNVHETEIKLATGYAYPDGSNVTQTEFDICPACFKTKLMPWLESQGAKPTVEDIGF